MADSENISTENMASMGEPTPEQMKKMFEEMQRKENEGLTPEEIEMKNKEREAKKKKNIAQFKEAEEIFQKGSYEKDGKTINLSLSPAEMSCAQVFLPEDIHNLTTQEAGANTCAFSCENKDALSLAHEKLQDPSYADENGNNKILLLNLASAIRPGGGVRDGMGGQEEDLCRSSSLLMSLESEAAKSYYDYNKALNTQLGSDAVIISPDVAVFRDDKGELLDEPFSLSVMTCSAPNVRFGYCGKTEDEYKELLYKRIEGLLRCAASLGYKNIILGAFGCGAFKNDAALVSDDFYQALTGSAGRGLAHADFAVLCTPGKEYNYNEFCRNFSKEKR